MVDTVRTQQELLDRMKINVAGVQVGRRADINVQTFRDFVISIPTLGGTGVSNPFAAADFCATNANGPCMQNEAASATNPTFVPDKTDRDTGLGSVSNTSLNAIVNGSSKMQWGTSLTIFAQTLAAAVSGGPTVRNNTATVTGPVFNPHSSLPNSGMGGDASGNVSMITNALERMRFSNAGLITFFQNLAANIATGPLVKNEAASATNPTLVPDQAVPTSGIGKSGASLDLIVAGISRLRVGTGIGNPNVIFQPMGTSGLLAGSVSGSFGLHNLAASATVPTLLPNFLSENTGVGSAVVGLALDLIVNGVDVFQITPSTAHMLVANGTVGAAAGAGSVIINRAVSATVPGIIPVKGTNTAGIGANVAGSVSIITGSTEHLRVDSVGNVTFFGLGLRILGGEVGGPAFVNEAASATNPTLVPNQQALSTGIGSTTPLQLSLIANSVEAMQLRSNQATMSVQLFGTNTSAYRLENVAATAIVPTLIPNRTGLTTGIGGITGAVSMIASAVERITANATGLGFFATTPAAQPTGVAVTAAAIHAALVTLGLITA